MRPQLHAALGLAGAMIAGPAAALTIISTADLGPSVDFVGADIGAQYVGASFSIPERAEIVRVGGHIVGSRFDGDIFAAIVRRTGPLPDTAPMDVATGALAYALFDPPNASADVRVEMNAIVEAGDYALILGNGLFGAGGTAKIVENNINADNMLFFFGSSSGSSWTSGGFSNARFVVEWEASPLPPPPPPPPPKITPAPPAIVALGLALAGFVVVRRRRRAPTL